MVYTAIYGTLTILSDMIIHPSSQQGFTYTLLIKSCAVAWHLEELVLHQCSIGNHATGDFGLFEFGPPGHGF